MPTPKTAPSAEGLGPVPAANQPGHHPDVEQDKPTGPPPGPAAAPARRRFDLPFDGLMRPFALLATVLPGTAYVEVDDDEVAIRFGLWHMAFPRDEVVGARETGGYSLPKVIGPPHVSLADHGITFASNRERGLCIELAHPQPGPYPLLRHPGVTVTVDDPAALANALQRP
jgi:hypothetical protein